VGKDEGRDESRDEGEEGVEEVGEGCRARQSRAGRSTADVS
jgi:hypothetical protein